MVVTNHDLQSATLAGGFTVYPPMVNQVSPNHGDNTGAVNLDVRGIGFVSGAQMKLTRAGRADIEATGEIFVSSKQVTCNIDLTGVEPGAWNLVVEQPGLDTCQLTNGFYVGSSYVAIWGEDINNQMVNAPTDLGYVDVTGGWSHSIALRSDGSIKAWGFDYHGQCSNAPTDTGFVAVAAGIEHSLALRSDGSIVSWGHEVYGLISGTPAGTGYVAISAGIYHSLALKSDGSIVSWGRDNFGQVSNTPTGSGFMAIAGEAGSAWASRPTALSWSGATIPSIR